MRLAPGGWSVGIATRKYGSDFRVFGVSESGEFEGPVDPSTRLEELPGFADAAPEGVHVWTLSGFNFDELAFDANGATVSLGGASLTLNGPASLGLVDAIDAYLAR